MDSIINFNEIEIFDDEISELEMLRKIIDKRKSEEPFHMLNLGDILMKYRVWLEQFPRIIPYYAVKCNPSPIVTKLLAVLGVNFDCASKGEISQVMGQGVSSDRIIFAHPVKFSAHIEYAKNFGVSMMTVDTEDEIKKIKLIYPKAKILIRIKCDTDVTTCRLGDKFGCDTEESTVKLIHSILAHEMELCGFSFHAGSPCHEPSAICRGVNLCKSLIDIARSLGCTNANIIDIGGGIPGGRGFNLKKFSDDINAVLKHVDPSITIIAEPGRYFVASASIAAACILSKRVVMKGNEKTFMYYVSDGVNGSFREESLKILERHPVVIYSKRLKNDMKYTSTVWGPTCSTTDCVVKETLLPEAEIGDWLGWYNLGEYSLCTSSRFNGLEHPVEYPIMKRTDWISLWQEVKDKA